MTSYYADESVTLLHGDAAVQLEALPVSSVDCVVTSPPYWGLRDYGVAEQIGWEPTPDAYVSALCRVFDGIARVLRPQGTVWLNIGDRYSARSDGFRRGANRRTRQPLIRLGSPDVLPKSLFGLPWRVALALHDRGWVVRNEVIWHKQHTTPEQAEDRLTTAHESIFLLARSRYYHFDRSALPVGDVWTFPVESRQGRHEAPFPEVLPWRCIAAGCPDGGVVLDPFSGTGTTGDAARKLGRRYVGIDLNRDYLDMQVARFAQGVLA